MAAVDAVAAKEKSCSANKLYRLFLDGTAGAEGGKVARSFAWSQTCTNPMRIIQI